MKKSKKRVWRLAVCASLAAVIAVGAFVIFGTDVAKSQNVSAGLQHLADTGYLAATADKGEPIAFDATFFDHAVRGGEVSAITVTALPDVMAGELLLGQGEVSVGQRIDRENLSYLSYIPLNGVDKASFSFVPQTKGKDASYALECQLLSLDRANCCPVPTGSVSAVSTHATLGVTGTLSAEDPEGDALYFEVMEYPAHGTLSLDTKTGNFSYLPTGDYHGEDVFRWRVQDAYGAFAEPCEVKITVRELAAGYLFSDMEDAGRHTCALLVSEKGLLSGEKLGGKHYFHPDRTLSRAAFVAILLEAAEIKVEDAEDTGFTDNADIPRGMRGAVKYAKEQGWLGTDSVFRPKDAITRGEAAAIAAKALGLSAPGYGDTVKDHVGIPVSVVDALYSAYEGGYITTSAEGNLLYAEALSRGDAAVFFARVLEKK